ncbi:ABC transporter permease [Sphaerisporangium sp. NPDC051017]|uniref:ABC transporter permease n=1 Tax=Sphaerisporangium sp. NPDC051017 TaxID=3154636 RepID=UPI00342D465A
MKFFARRVAQALFVLWAAYTVSFVILYMLPGDPVSVLAGTEAGRDITPEQLDALRHEYGLDRPVTVQYFVRLGQVVRGDFGRSVQSHQPVQTMIADALPATAQIAGLGLLLAVVFGAGLALPATYVSWGWLRQTLLSLPPLGVAIPSFWFGLLLLQVFSFKLGLFPVVGNEGFASVVLPAVTLALPSAATIAQLLAKSMSATLREPYIETARAKGAGRPRIHLRHAVRNAALPALTVAGLVVGNLLAGAVVTETVFSRTGLGRVTALAVTTQDIPVVQGLVVFAALVFVLVNLAVDLVYPLLDPRIARPSATAS